MAAVVLDLAAAGVHWEVTETPCDWFGRAKIAPAAVSRSVDVPLPVVAPSAAVRGRTVPLLRPKVLAGGEVWACGEGGGLVVVAACAVRGKGQPPLNAREQALLEKMLAAVGMGPVSGWVAVGQDDEQLRGNLHEPAREAWRGLNPTQTLVLGQVGLGTLLGHSCGVEAWQGKAPLWDGAETARVGVTYRPDLLLDKPLFKRLAWQHMLTWQARTKEVTA